MEVGHLGVLSIGFDNLDSSDGNSTSITSVVDAAGNTWTKAREYTNGEGGAGNGITISVWYVVATTQLNSAASITITFSSAVTAKAIKGVEFSGLTAATIQVDGTQDNAYDAADVGSATATGSHNVEHIWYRGIAGEEAGTAWTNTSGWTKSNATASSGSTADTNATVGAEFRIGTGVSPASSSDPTWFTADFATTLVGFIEPPPTPTPTATPEHGAFTGLGTFITAATKTTGSTWTPSISATLEVGHLAVIAIGGDNIATSDGTSSFVSSVTDAGGNTWVKAREYTNGEGSAGAGASVSVWYAVIGSHVETGTQLSITFNGTIDAKVVKGYEFLKPSGAMVTDGTTNRADDATDPGSLITNGATTGEYIFVRATALEAISTTWTQTSGWTKVNANATSGGADDSNIVVGWEFNIESSNVGPDSNPTFYTADSASVYVGLTLSGQPTATPTPVPTNTPTPTVTPTPGPPFSGIGTFLTAAQKSTGVVSATFTPSTGAPLLAGQMAVIVIGLDNENDGSDGNTSLVTSVVDEAGNTYTKAREYTNGQGAPRAGVTLSVWYKKVTTTLPQGDTVTITFSEPIVAKAVKGYNFQWPSTGNPVVDGGPSDAQYDSADPSGMSVTGSNGQMHLWIRANAAESPGKTWTSTAGWTRVNAAATSLDLPDSNIAVGFEFKTQIGSSSGTSDPAWYTADHASIMLGFYDDSPAATPTPTPTVGPTLTPTPTPTIDTSTRYDCVKVTNLNNSGAGSFRECAERSGPTFCVFEVSGRIDHTSNVLVKADHFIAGQTAPSPGIMMTRGTIILGYSNTWLEHLQVRIGDAEGTPSYNQRDAIQISTFGRPAASNINVRNVTASWAIDENVSTFGDTDLVTFENSIIAEGLNLSYHNEGTGDEPHSSGLIIGENGRRTRFLRNLFVHNRDRNPLLKNNSQAEFINNFIYNHGPTQKSNIPRMEYLSTTLGPSKFDAIGNYLKPGFDSLTGMYGLWIDVGLPPELGMYYVRGNRGDTRPSEALPESAWVKPGKEANQSETPLLGLTDENEILDADNLLDWLQAHAGARPWERNAIDERYFENARLGTGQVIDCIITERCTFGDVQVPEGGFPVMAQNTRAVDCAADYNIVELKAFLQQYEGNPPTPTPTPTPTITPGGPTLTPTPTPNPDLRKHLSVLHAG